MPHNIPIAELDEDGKPREALTVEISEEEIGDLKIGQKIEVVIKGSVGMLQVPPEGSTEEDPPLLGIRVDSKTIKGSNEFAELAKDEDDEG